MSLYLKVVLGYLYVIHKDNMILQVFWAYLWCHQKPAHRQPYVFFFLPYLHSWKWKDKRNNCL